MIYEATLQDHAEAFWRKQLPGLSDDLVTRMAFSFGCNTEAISTRHRQELCELVMDYLYSEGLVGAGKDGWIWDDGQMISIGWRILPSPFWDQLHDAIRTFENSSGRRQSKPITA